MKCKKNPCNKKAPLRADNIKEITLDFHLFGWQSRVISLSSWAQSLGNLTFCGFDTAFFCSVNPSVGIHNSCCFTKGYICNRKIWKVASVVQINY